MTDHEFYSEFLPALRGCFPGHADWLAKQGDRARAAWCKALRRNATEDAVKALEMIQAGDATGPKGRDDYPRCINGICARIRAEREPAVKIDTTQPHQVDGEWTFACLQCEDGGTVSIHGYRSVKKLIDGAAWGDPGTLYSASAACTCGAGDRFTRWKGRPLPRYNPKTMVLCQSGIYRSEYPEALREFVERIQGRPAPECQPDLFPDAVAPADQRGRRLQKSLARNPWQKPPQPVH